MKKTKTKGRPLFSTRKLRNGVREPIRSGCLIRSRKLCQAKLAREKEAEHNNITMNMTMKQKSYQAAFRI